jgi:predicted ATPase
MDWVNIIVLATAIVGGIAAIVAIVQAVDQWREKRRQRDSAAAGVLQPQPQDAAPPPTLPARRLTNLPVQPTGLIGRETEIAEVAAMLLRPDVRLVTLTGPAGIGKTRLALQLAAGSLEQYADGVFFVGLASVTDPDLVAPTIAQVLDVREQGAGPLVVTLRDQLHDKQMLLVLDNFEQVVAAAPVIAELLAAAAKLKILVTSREVLRIYGEHAFAVPPLELPDLERLPAGGDLVPTLTQYEALCLFIERAQAAKADFTLTNANGPAVAEICYRLDGLPLAIELAAARIRLLSPQAMLQRLTVATGGSSLHLLTGGARDLPARQQTMRSTIAWSYDLLDKAEQDLFQCLGVFASGWTLEAAEAVCKAPGDLDLMDRLESLIGKSLIRQWQADGEVRFVMLQTIREYALERLEEAGGAAAARRAHADFYLGYVEQAEPQLYGSAQMEWLKRLETEQDNLRAALDWAIANGAIANGRGEIALRLAGSLAWFWNLRGRVSEGRGWLEAALAAPGAEPTEARAKALLGLGELVSNQADWATVWDAVEESVRMARDLGNRKLLAHALASLSLFKVRGAHADSAGTQPLADESLALARAVGEPWTLGYVLTVLDIRNLLLGNDNQGSALSEEALRCFEATGDQWGMVLTLRHLGLGAIARADYAAARAASEKSVTASRALGDRLGEAYTLSSLGDIARLQDDYEGAAAYYEESLALYRDLGLKADIPASLHNLGHVALARGDTATAQALQTQSLTLHRELGNKAGMVEAVSGLAAVARVTGEPLRSARLFGAVEALRRTLGVPIWPAEQAEYDRQVTALHRQLDETALAQAWTEGRMMTLEQAVAEALEATPAGN